MSKNMYIVLLAATAVLSACGGTPEASSGCAREYPTDGTDSFIMRTGISITSLEEEGYKFENPGLFWINETTGEFCVGSGVVVHFPDGTIYEGPQKGFHGE